MLLSENTEMKSQEEFIVALLTVFLAFSVPVSLVASVMLSIYAQLSSHVLATRERESGNKHARNCVHLER